MGLMIKLQENQTDFSNLKIGTVFRYDNMVFIKTDGSLYNADDKRVIAWALNGSYSITSKPRPQDFTVINKGTIFEVE
tara:strand:+ start:3104 stop:3337 length:234 start_codon:yes stop_codon:yes gene_type:complete